MPSRKYTPPSPVVTDLRQWRARKDHNGGPPLDGSPLDELAPVTWLARGSLHHSALFSATQGRYRKQLVDEPMSGHDVFGYGKLELSFTGEQLNQTDALIFDHLCDLARHSPEGVEAPLVISRRGLLRTVGKGGGGNQMAEAHASLSRMAMGKLHVTHHLRPDMPDTAHVEKFPLLKRFDETEAGWLIQVERRATALTGDYAEFQSAILIQLGRQPLASRLYRLIASMSAKVDSFKLDKLQASAPNRQPAWKFKQQVGKAMTRLQELGVVSSFKLSKSRLDFVRA